MARMISSLASIPPFSLTLIDVTSLDTFRWNVNDDIVNLFSDKIGGYDMDTTDSSGILTG